MKTKRLTEFLIVVLISLTTSFGAKADNGAKSMSKKELAALTQSISEALQAEYIFPEVATKISEVLKTNTEKGVYGKYVDRIELSEKLTDDIRSVNGDSHLNVLYTQANGPMRMVRRGGPGGANPQMLKKLARNNFGFESVKILEGNVGYVNLTSMVSPAYAGDTAAAVMQYLYNTDAIIFDLRQNRGGAGEMYQLLASYLFEAQPLKLNEIYWPSEDRRYQIWTLPHVPGKRMPNKDIYILTSSMTGSAAEVFSYTLKHYDRATIVGETTVGVANPVSPTQITEEFTVLMSKGESKHPVTKTNFEGKGVIPHVKTPRSQALDTAYMLALTNLSSDNKEDSSYYDWYQEIIKAKVDTPAIDKKVPLSYAGTFVSQSGEQRITKVIDGQLWYGADERRLSALIPLSNTRFMIPEDKGFKLEIMISNGKVQGINRLFNSGRVIPMTKL